MTKPKPTKTPLQETLDILEGMMESKATADLDAWLDGIAIDATRNGGPNEKA